MNPDDVGASLQRSLDEYETWAVPWKPCSTSSLTIQTVDDSDGRVLLKVSTVAEWPDREPYIDFSESVPRAEAGAKVTQVIDDAIRRHCMTRELINPMERVRAWVVPEDIPTIREKYDDIFSHVVDMTDRGMHANEQANELIKTFRLRAGPQMFDSRIPPAERAKLAAKQNNLNERLRQNAVHLEYSSRMLQDHKKFLKDPARL